MQTVESITKKIISEYRPKRIILFGSHAWGTPHPDSDIDLLIIADSQHSRTQRKRELYALLRDRTVPVDVLVYTPEELEKKIQYERNLFLKDIVTNGKVVYAE